MSSRLGDDHRATCASLQPTPLLLIRCHRHLPKLPTRLALVRWRPGPLSQRRPTTDRRATARPLTWLQCDVTAAASSPPIPRTGSQFLAPGATSDANPTAPSPPSWRPLRSAVSGHWEQFAEADRRRHDLQLSSASCPAAWNQDIRMSLPASRVRLRFCIDMGA